MSQNITRIAFVCVQNAGRSQMAFAFAERERNVRKLADSIEIRTGGTQPANSVHEEVVEVMQEKDIDLRNRTPREIIHYDLQDCEYVITMGCSAEGVCPATWSGENRDWGLADPHGKDLETVREIRDEIEIRVNSLFNEITGKQQTNN
ncbi:arsenate reductase/protein-tyrosine-phosphatase family protein [Natrialba asiatica]|uniref:Protein tyrosine phosphatase n=1 Tax=Natrialba asiatica (strain ATCC 700177 / DSM 12278 / JCM 9576 / FERM P-10747 / NBRC 102637 / 172P1) TaxID=29540 RepID=M0AGD0_NATA1|nr:protein-tyrosine-phosphatase [Natrialba asiatica]ELY97431.1 protein tyrosine phosphatase [Natrialba asiatica DSM 12278]